MTVIPISADAPGLKRNPSQRTIDRRSETVEATSLAAMQGSPAPSESYIQPK
jgi:hypothetical protein